MLVAMLDAHAAVGAMLPDHVAEQLGLRGATKAQFAAVFREMVGARVKPRAGSVKCSRFLVHLRVQAGSRRGFQLAGTIWWLVPC